MAAARRDLGFSSEVVYESSLLLNAARIEEGLQLRYHKKLPLGVRLWRVPGAGKGSNKEDLNEQNIYKVFITHSTMVCKAIVDKNVKIEF